MSRCPASVRRHLGLPAVLLALVAGAVLGGYADGSDLAVHFIDVGHGDAILIDYGEFEILIDGGGSATWVPYLKGYIEGSVDLLIVTHPHADHIGGLPAVLTQYKVNEAWTSGSTYTTESYQRYAVALNESGAAVIPVTCGYARAFADLGILLEVLHPCALRGNLNDDSVVVRMTYKGVVFLFTGDLENSGERQLLDRIVLSAVDVLKVAHHGSSSSSSLDFLKAVQPKISVISGRPTDQTVMALAQTGTDIWRTDIHGSIVLSVDDTGVLVAPQQDRVLAPVGLSATRSTLGTSVDLRWFDISGNEESFEVQRGADAATLRPIASLPANSSSYTDHTARSDSIYVYQVVAVGRTESAASPVVTIPPFLTFQLLSYSSSIQRGLEAHLSAQTTPGSSWELEYITPAGRKSTAEGLGRRTADSRGLINWRWLISGSTGPGTGKLNIYTADAHRVLWLTLPITIYTK